MKEINDFITFRVMNTKVDILSTNTINGIHTVAEIDGHFYHLGDVEPDVSAAITAWQGYFGKTLTDKEFELTIKNNTTAAT